MQVAKQDALNAINQLPDTVDMEEIMYRLYVLESIRRRQKDSAEGKTQTIDEVRKEIQSW